MEGSEQVMISHLQGLTKVKRGTTIGTFGGQPVACWSVGVVCETSLAVNMTCVQ